MDTLEKGTLIIGIFIKGTGLVLFPDIRWQLSHDRQKFRTSTLAPGQKNLVEIFVKVLL
jgi:hypothetical protein